MLLPLTANTNNKSKHTAHLLCARPCAVSLNSENNLLRWVLLLPSFTDKETGWGHRKVKSFVHITELVSSRVWPAWLPKEGS